MTADGLGLRVLGSTFRVSGPAEALREASRLWSPFRADVPAEAAGADLALVEGDTTVAMRQLSVEINRTALHLNSDVALHAGVVVTPGGHTVVLPGDSGSGKSTIVAALVRAGCAYVSDEGLVLRRAGAGQIVPYPKPIALSPWSSQAVGLIDCDGDLSGSDAEEALYTAEDLGSVVANRAPPPSVILVRVRNSHPRAHLTALPRSPAVPLLLSLCFNHFRWPDRALVLVGDVVRGADVLELRYSAPMAAATYLIGAVDGA